MIQKIIELSLSSFLNNSHRESTKSLKVKLNYLNLDFDGQSLKISASKLLIIRFISKFILQAFKNIFIMLIYSFRDSSGKKSASLMYGVPNDIIFCNSDDLDFIDFCSNCDITPLKTSSRIEVELARFAVSSSNDYLSYSKCPLFALVKKNPPSYLDFFKFLKVHFSIHFSFLLELFRNPMLLFVAQDITFYGVVDYLDSNNLIESIFITNSNYMSQPLWMRQWNGRGYKTYMLWYSENTIPFSFKESPFSNPLPNNRHIAVDEMMVWSRYFKKYLEKIGVNATIKIVNPILFYLDKNKPKKNKKDFDIIIFDITPFSAESSLLLGHYESYYNFSNCMMFIKSIVQISTELENELNIKINLNLKSKRQYHQYHDIQYINYIKSLSERRLINLVSPSDNIFDLLNANDISIVVPFSSPAIVARYLCRKTFYYDSAKVLLPRHKNEKFINFSSGPDELKLSIYNYIKTYKSAF